MVKDMSKQKQYCEASIARVYSEHGRGSQVILRPPPVELDTRCIETKRSKQYSDTDARVSALLQTIIREEYNGIDVDVELWRVHKRAQIGGVDFTSSEDIKGVRKGGEHMKRCGSVITLVRGGRSLYAWVICFMSYDRIHVAHVEWLPIPDYPTGSPVVVRLTRGDPTPLEPCVMSLLDIEPSRICVIHERTCMYMVHLSGVSTMLTR